MALGSSAAVTKHPDAYSNLCSKHGEEVVSVNAVAKFYSKMSRSSVLVCWGYEQMTLQVFLTRPSSHIQDRCFACDFK